MQANGQSQNVSVDNNVVIIHVQQNGMDAWILQDFDRVSTWVHGHRQYSAQVSVHLQCFVSLMTPSDSAINVIMCFMFQTVDTKY